MSLIDKQEVQEIYEHTLHCALNGADLYVKERHKIRHYRTTSTEERMPNGDFLLRPVHT